MIRGAKLRNPANIKNSLILGFALFAMFFGAGNLIFPPFIGYESGNMWPLGFACFLTADVILACVGIYVLNAAGGSITSIENTLGKIPGSILGVIGVLCIGVVFAMPRTAATTYEMAIVPNFGNNIGLFLFSIIFFLISFALSVRESKIMDIIGKFFTPVLVLGILILVVAGIINPIGVIGPAKTALVVQDGIKAGYQTMDVLGVIAFAIILMDSIKAQGVTNKKDVLSMVALSSIVSVILLAIIYGGLTYLGATAQNITVYSHAQLLVSITNRLLGDFGVIVLGIVVAVACITTAVALIGSTASFFFHLFNEKIPYKMLVGINCIVGLVVCNLGLETIVDYANPILGVVCPPFVTLIILLLFQRYIKSLGIYKGAVLLSIIGAIIIELHQYAAVPINVEWLPLYSYGLGWILFAIIGGLIGWATSHLCAKRPHQQPNYS